MPIPPHYDLNSLNLPPLRAPSEYYDLMSTRESVPLLQTSLSFQINTKYRGLDGHYRIEVLADDEPYRSVEEPYFQFVPKLGADEGKHLTINIYYRQFQSDEYQLLKVYHATIEPPPLLVFDCPHSSDAGKEVYLVVAYGDRCNASMPVSDSLEVESDGYFLPKALRVWHRHDRGALSVFGDDVRYDDLLVGRPTDADTTMTYILKPTSKWMESGGKTKLIRLTIVDPITKQSAECYLKLVTTAAD